MQLQSFKILQRYNRLIRNYFNESKFIYTLVKEGDRGIALFVNFTIRCIDDALSLNNKLIVLLLTISHRSLQIQIRLLHWQYTYTHHDSNTQNLYDKRDFYFSIVNFPFFDRNIPTSPAYDVYMSQLLQSMFALIICWRKQSIDEEAHSLGVQLFGLWSIQSKSCQN